MLHLIRFALVAALLCASGSLVYASKVKTWNQARAASFDKAQFKGTVVTSEGVLRLARKLKPLADLDAAHVWDVVEDGAGNLLVATGDEGKLYRVTPDGRSTVIFESEDSQILSLCRAANGSVYAGTGPSGLILRVTPEGMPSIFSRTNESYVWCLVSTASGRLLAGTGPHGRIYQIDAQGRAALFYGTKQEHVLCLAEGPNDLVYAGTDKHGLVYRLDRQGKGFVMYHAPQAEVHALVASGDGVYAGTSSPRWRNLPSSISAGDRLGPDSQQVLVSNPHAHGNKAAELPVPMAAPPSAPNAGHEDRTSNSLPGLSPTSGENSVYHIGNDGAVREIFREKAMILSLVRQGGDVLIGTGMEGQLFQVDEATKERSEIARLDHGEIHALYRRRDGSIVIGTGDPGKLYVLQQQYVAAGTVTSEVLDARLISKWGALGWSPSLPKDTQVSVAVRSGNLAEPDDTWSAWSAEQTDPERAIALAPPARFLQYRVAMSTADPAVTPEVRGLWIRYMTINQAPEISSIEVPDPNNAVSDNPKRLHFKWNATDPNDDELTYSLSIRKQGWRNWVLLEEGLERREYDWDTSTAPAGMYQVKIVASDRKDNPAEIAFCSERISQAFPVAHDAPTVRLRLISVEGQQALIEAEASDTMVRLTAAAYSTNGKKWVNVFPIGGLFDSKKETFRFRAEVAKPGPYVVVLRVQDAAGNTGSGDVVFTVTEPDSRH
jgi:hypothetical protein